MWKLVAVVAAGLYGATGCATKGDIEQLQQEMRASTSQIEALKGETKTGFEATKKQIEERERQLAQDLKVQQEALAKLSEVVKAEQARLAEQGVRLETLSKDEADLRSSVRDTARMLQDFLKAEEARLKESLRWVQSTLKDLAAEDKSKEEEKPLEEKAKKEEKPKKEEKSK
jgi:phosphoenolpyruvate-protein kinase (PTS system EI component)